MKEIYIPLSVEIDGEQIKFTPESEDWWTSCIANLRLYDLHYCEDYNTINVYPVRRGERVDKAIITTSIFCEDCDMRVYECACVPMPITCINCNNEVKEEGHFCGEYCVKEYRDMIWGDN